jgi:hypothetical protein
MAACTPNGTLSQPIGANSSGPFGLDARKGLWAILSQLTGSMEPSNGGLHRRPEVPYKDVKPGMIQLLLVVAALLSNCNPLVADKLDEFIMDGQANSVYGTKKTC